MNYRRGWDRTAASAAFFNASSPGMRSDRARLGLVGGDAVLEHGDRPSSREGLFTVVKMSGTLPQRSQAQLDLFGMVPVDTLTKSPLFFGLGTRSSSAGPGAAHAACSTWPDERTCSCDYASASVWCPSARSRKPSATSSTPNAMAYASRRTAALGTRPAAECPRLVRAGAAAQSETH